MAPITCEFSDDLVANQSRRQRAPGRRTRSFGDGPPTTGHRYPAGRLNGWITTCGSSPTGGRCSATATSRDRGCSPATSARSTDPGKTGGCSVTAQAAPTCTASPGPGSSVTRWSQRPGVPRRPGTGRILDLATTQSTPAGQQDQPKAAHSPGRPLPRLPRDASRRRGPATEPRRLGTMADRQPHRDHHDHDPSGRHDGRG